MPSESARPLAGRILRVVLGSGEVADRDLLARFAATREEDAFAELVRRHGPMVLGVCRRVTGHPHDAEDAFQAAFVVLARRAAQVARPEQLANWLYGVALRTALEARKARRRVQEQPVSAAPEPAAPPEPDDNTDLRRVIDEELARLPDKYRAAVVLCDLEGVSRSAAAVQLKIPEGTLSSRLAHARKVLAGRLSRRGVTASAALITSILGREAVSAVPRELVVLTARVARAAVAGAVPAGAVSASVSSLADGAMKTMLATRLRTMLGAVAACGLLGLGAYGLAQVPGQNGVPPIPDQPLPPPPAVTVVGQPANNPFWEPELIDAEQGKSAEKVAARGIEDDDVPYASTPSQAVVRVEDSKLIVRQRVAAYRATSQNVNGHTIHSYQRKSSVQASTHDAADVSVFDMKGNRLQPKVWKERLKMDVHALVAFDGKLPNPREMTLFKEDTLLVVLPASQTAVTGYGAANGYNTQPPAVTAPAVPAPFAAPPALRPSTPPPAVPSTTVRPPRATPVPPTPPAGAPDLPPEPDGT
jgi:RNA polymerase sigma factor (sigma-70 family)